MMSKESAMRCLFWGLSLAAVAVAANMMLTM